MTLAKDIYTNRFKHPKSLEARLQVLCTLRRDFKEYVFAKTENLFQQYCVVYETRVSEYDPRRLYAQVAKYYSKT